MNNKFYDKIFVGLHPMANYQNTGEVFTMPYYKGIENSLSILIRENYILLRVCQMTKF